MNRAERFGHRLAQATTKYPQRAKVAGWIIVVALLFLAIAMVWQAVSQDRIYKVAIAIVLAAIFGWRHYKRAKGGLEKAG